MRTSHLQARLRGARLVAAVLVGVLAGLPGVASGARKHTRASSGQLRTFPIRTHYNEPSPQFDGVFCRPSQLERCPGMNFTGGVRFTGTMAGDGRFDLVAWWLPSGDLAYEGPNYVTGKIDGCGEGTFAIIDENGRLYFSRTDAGTQMTPGTNEFTVEPWGPHPVPGLVSGIGLNVWRASSLAQDDTYGEGDFTGTVTCWVRTRR